MNGLQDGTSKLRGNDFDRRKRQPDLRVIGLDMETSITRHLKAFPLQTFMTTGLE